MDVIGEWLTLILIPANDQILNKKKTIYQSNIQVIAQDTETFVI